MQDEIEPNMDWGQFILLKELTKSEGLNFHFQKSSIQPLYWDFNGMLESFRGRNAKAEWIELDGQRRLRISSKSEIANS